MLRATLTPLLMHAYILYLCLIYELSCVAVLLTYTSACVVSYAAASSV
jgi:hypothetical protein